MQQHISRKSTRLWDFFIGAWTLNRRIHGTATGNAIAVLEDAAADWTPTEQHPHSQSAMLYTERGELQHFGGCAEPTRMEVSRQYLYGFDEEDSVDVWFWQPGQSDHLKLFHRFTLPPEASESIRSHTVLTYLHRPCRL